MQQSQETPDASKHDLIATDGTLPGFGTLHQRSGSMGDAQQNGLDSSSTPDLHTKQTAEQKHCNSYSQAAAQLDQMPDEGRGAAESEVSFQAETGTELQHGLQQACATLQQAREQHGTQDLRPLAHGSEYQACVQDCALQWQASSAIDEPKHHIVSAHHTQDDSSHCHTDATTLLHHTVGLSSFYTNVLPDKLCSGNAELHDSTQLCGEQHLAFTETASEQDSCSERDIETVQQPAETVQPPAEPIVSCDDTQLAAGIQQGCKSWYTGRALSEASSASDGEEGTPTPSGRDSILEAQSPLPQFHLSYDAAQMENTSYVSHASSSTCSDVVDDMAAEPSTDMAVADTESSCSRLRHQDTAVKQQSITAFRSR